MKNDVSVPVSRVPEMIRRSAEAMRALVPGCRPVPFGHMGDGNFHIIPLMKLEDKRDRKKILPAMKEVNNLVLKYGGSLSGEHNDGLVRGPWLEQMYGKEMLQLFRETKNIFDPQHIFNPHKKANATWDYSYSHIREHF
mgnify:CR=1 FL=1